MNTHAIDPAICEKTTMKETRPMPAIDRLLTTASRAAATAAVALVAAFAVSASAQAAPAFDLSLTHNPSTMPRTDQYLEYLATVTNGASPVPAVGEAVSCNGIETADGAPKNWHPGAPGAAGFPEFSFAWVRDGVAIPGETSQTYTIAAADQGKVVQCLVTGTNAVAAATYASVPGRVADPQPASPPPAPSDRTAFGSRPTVAPVSGTAPRTCTAPPNWPQPPDTTYAFQWLRNGVAIPGATDQPTPTTSTYTPDVGEGQPDEGKVLQCQVVATNAGGSLVGISDTSQVNVSGDMPILSAAQNPEVDLPSSTTAGTVTVVVQLPQGMRVQRVSNPASSSNPPAPPVGWSCSVVEPSEFEGGRAVCSRLDALGPEASWPQIMVLAAIDGEAPDPAVAVLSASGGGAPAVSVSDPFSFSGPGFPFGIESNVFVARALDGAGGDLAVAGAHPVSAMATFSINTYRRPDGNRISVGHIRSVSTDLPAGFVGNLEAVPGRCGSVASILNDKLAQPEQPGCPRAAIVGGVTANTADSGPYTSAPLWAIVPERGAPAQFVFGFSGPQVTYTLTPRLRPGDGYAIAVDAPKVSKGPVFSSVTATLCGAGANLTPSLDTADGHQVGDTLFAGCKQPSAPGANPVPFLTNPTACPGGSAVTELAVDSWEEPGVRDGAVALAPAVEGCDGLLFAPQVQIAPTASTPDSASGVDARISFADEGLVDHDGRAQSHLDKAVVRLPEGFSVNPSGATGLAGCSDQQLGILSVSSESQVIAGSPTELSFDGESVGVPYGATRQQIASALESLPAIGAGGVSVTGSGGGPWRVQFTGQHAGRDVPLISGSGSEVQRLSLTPVLSAMFGTYTLTFDGQTTTPLQYNASRDAIRAALVALPNIGAGDVVVSGGPIFGGGTGTLLLSAKPDYTIAFTGTLADTDVPQLSVSSSVFGATLGVSTASDGGEPVEVFTAREAGEARYDDREPSCPEGSRIGTVEIDTPLLAEDLTGEVVLLAPRSTDPESGEMLRMAIVARNTDRGLLVKVAGSATADSETGRLVATFDNNPQVPFSDLRVRFKGGQRGVIATPQDCGTTQTETTLTPWSGNQPDVSTTDHQVAGDCSLGFAPKLAAGMSTQAARANGAFSFRFTRQDGEQWIDGLTAKLPKGLLASVNGFPLCSSAQAAAGDCPASSRIGTVDATAGTGNPFVLEQKGSAYLTQGYKGCPYGLMVKVPVVAGPFDKSSPATDLGDIVVRQAVCVDASTAEVSAVSDPLPTIWHGIPIRMRSVTVVVDRPGFMLNPSNCAPKQVGASFDSARDATADASSPFNNTGCAALAFAPKLTLGLTGRRQIRTGRHPGIRAQVTQQGISEAGIAKARVVLPKSLALDVNNAQALCEYEDGTKPDLENHCPQGSIVGRARAISPLLNDPLAGNVYFVKNIRRDPNTGNIIRTLPMIIAALRGEIAINLIGRSSVDGRNRLVSTFRSVPDAPITRFNMNIAGGQNGILAVTRTRRALINLCAKPRSHVAESDIDGHNGRRHDRNIRMTTPCTRRQIKQAKKAAKRATQARKTTTRRT